MALFSSVDIQKPPLSGYCTIIEQCTVPGKKILCPAQACDGCSKRLLIDGIDLSYRAKPRQAQHRQPMQQGPEAVDLLLDAFYRQEDELAALDPRLDAEAQPAIGRVARKLIQAPHQPGRREYLAEDQPVAVVVLAGKRQVGISNGKEPLSRRLAMRSTRDLFAQLSEAPRDKRVEDLVLAGVILIEARWTIFDALRQFAHRKCLKAVLGYDSERSIQDSFARPGSAPRAWCLTPRHFGTSFLFRTLFVNSIAFKQGFVKG